MKKRIYSKKLNRSTTARRALYRSLARNLLEFGKIKTTLAKAKALVPFMERLIVTAKINNLSARRMVLASLANDRKTVNRVFAVAAVNSQKSGFTRITPLTPRKGDNAKLAILEIINMPKVEKDKEKGKAKGKAKKNIKTEKVTEESKKSKK
jgi:large subunit ribosomal protein L17